MSNTGHLSKVSPPSTTAPQHDGLNVLWFLPTHGDGRYLGTGLGARETDIDYLRQVAQAADRLGYYGVLIPTGKSCEDSWLVASALAPVTKKLRFLVAVRPGLASPTLYGRMTATLDRISDGRLLINIVTGGDPVENAGDGIFLNHDERYEVTDEFLTVYRRLLAGEHVRYCGKHIKVDDAHLLFPPQQAGGPALYFGGSSDAANKVAAQHVDKYLTWGEPPAAVAAKISQVRALAEAEGRKVSFGIRLHVIARETDAKAWEAAEDLIRYLDDDTIAAAQKVFSRLDSVGQSRMQALHGGRRDKLEISPNLWAGVGLVRGGAGTALVGSGETVAARMQEYADLGIDSFILSGYPHLEEAYRVAELVLPRLKLNHGIAQGPAGVNTGPFGETIANDYRPAARFRLMSAADVEGRELHVPVAIIGGGFSGAAVAWHLLRLRPDLERVVIIEPRAEIGRGLAYSAGDPSHRINVPATRMSLLPDQPTHFNDWLEASGALDADPAARMADGRNFPARSVFGAYVAEQLATLGPRVVHVRAAAEAVDAIKGGYRIRSSDGSTVHADLVVLAVAHAPPSPPPVLATALAGHPRFVPDPWQTEALAAIRPRDRVLIVGTGLTMADIVASLDRLGHRGEIVAVSRRGLRSRGHPAVLHEPFGDFAAAPARTVRELVRRIRATIRAAQAQGRSWHCVLDQVRLQGSTIWNALPLAERKRLLRHLRPFWDVHRFRIAPQVEQGLDDRLAAGTLALRAASLKEVRREGDAIEVSLRVRRTGAVTQETFDAVITATGPAHGRVFADNPVLAGLRVAGLARPDPLRLGIEVAVDGRTIGADCTPQGGLYVAGPLARGTVGELMGLPDVTNYAIRVAENVARQLGARDVSDVSARRYTSA